MGDLPVGIHLVWEIAMDMPAVLKKEFDMEFKIL